MGGADTTRERSTGSTLGLVVLLLVGTAGCLAGCGGGSPDRLVGEWITEDPNGTRHTLVFRADGTASSTALAGPHEDAERLRYELEGSGSPSRLNLEGFQRGPLQGQVLYCVVGFDGDDAFRMNCIAGPPGRDDVRPSSLGIGSMTYRRTVP